MEPISKVYAEKLSVLANEIHNEFNRLTKLVSKTDIDIQDILHVLEFNNFTEEEAYEFALEIKKTRQERRKYKDEIESFHTLASVVDIKRINKALRKINYRYQQVQLSNTTNGNETEIGNNE